ncbi:MAG: hypothetical protein ACK4IK_09600 [Bacteroidia bacterium]
MAKSNFSKALGRELGKNTGKFISNKLFGDGHATPYRISARVQAAELRASGMKAQADALRAQANAELEKEKMRINLEKEREEGVLIQEIAKTFFSDDKDEVFQTIGALLSLAESHSSKTVKNAALSKVESGNLKLMQLGCSTEANFYDKKVKKIKQRLMLPLYIGFLGIILGVVGAIMIGVGKKDTQTLGLLILTGSLFISIFGISNYFKK